METTAVAFQNEKKSLIISHIKKPGHYNMTRQHFHDEFEVYYLISGERHYFIGDRTYPVQKGDLVLIDQYALHKTSDAGIPDHERIMIRFKNDYFVNENYSVKDILLFLFDGSHNVIRFPSHDQTNIENFLYRMIHEIKYQNRGFEAQLHSLLIQMLVYSSRYVDQNCLFPLEHPSPMHQKISEIVQYINQNYSNTMTLSSISKYFYISPYYLTRVFKEATGFTFVEYLTNMRIKESQRLLRETKWKVSRVAEEAGFRSIAHFQRIFKKMTGSSPLHYRKIAGF